MAPQRVVRRAVEHKWLIVATLVVCTVIFLTSFLGTSDRERIDRVATETHSALCALKADVRRRWIAGERYRQRVALGEAQIIAGLTMADLDRSLAGQRSTLDALAHLDCTDRPKEAK